MTELAQYLEHTLLKPEATVADIIKICEEAKKYQLGDSVEKIAKDLLMSVEEVEEIRTGQEIKFGRVRS